MDVTGPIKVALQASTSAKDTEFTAALVDVAPDGYSLLMQKVLLDQLVKRHYRRKWS
jgi:predicted acyl esterase